MLHIDDGVSLKSDAAVRKHLRSAIFPRMDTSPPPAPQGTIEPTWSPQWAIYGDAEAGIKKLLDSGVLKDDGPTGLTVEETGQMVPELMETFDRPLWRIVADGAKISVDPASSGGTFLVASGFAELKLPDNLRRWSLIKIVATKEGEASVIPTGWPTTQSPPSFDNQTGWTLSPGPQQVCVVDLWLRVIPLHMLWLKNECKIRHSAIEKGMSPFLR
jgi:hypothetical protein